MVREIEKNLNKHADYWVRITQAGGNTGQARRIKGNVKSIDNQIPVLSGSGKDHKEVIEEKVGPDVRPIMGAMVGPNCCLSFN